MRSEFLSLNASTAVVKAASIIKVLNPRASVYSRSNVSLAKVSDVTQLEASLMDKEPIREFNGMQVGKTVYWLDIQDRGPGGNLIAVKAYVRGVHFSVDSMELGESDLFELRD